MDLSIIIVNFNTKKLVHQTLNSIILYTKDIEYEIIVVDNSTNKSEQCEYENNLVKIYKDIDNHGFGHACNFGASKSCGKYYLFLNSDTLIHDNCLKECVDYMKLNDTIGVLGPKVILANKSLDHGCKRGFPTPSAAFYYYLGLDRKYPNSRKYGSYRQTFLDEDTISEVDSVSGSCLMIKSKLFEGLKGFDETFFMYGEDLDLCYRVKKLGYKVVYYPKACITHLKGQSGLYKSSKKVIYHFYDAMLIFYNKHYRKNYNILITWTIYVAVKFKYYSTLFKRWIN